MTGGCLGVCLGVGWAAGLGVGSGSCLGSSLGSSAGGLAGLGAGGEEMLASQWGQGPVTPAISIGTRSCVWQFGQENSTVSDMV